MNPPSNSTVMPDAPRSALDWPNHAGFGDAFRDRIRQRMKKERRKKTTAGVSAVALTCLAFWLVPLVCQTRTVATLAAHRQTLALADGSQADLSGQTLVSTDFRYGRRRVRLTQGEALFSVTKDPAHPFTVETSAGLIQVTGTRFNVRLGAEGVAEVTLVEGAVSVLPVVNRGDPPEAAVQLRPNQQLTLSEGKHTLRTLSAEAVSNAVSWRDGSLVLDGLSLGEACARLSSYFGKKIVVAAEAADLRPGGNYDLDDLQGFLDAFQIALSVKVLRENDGSYRIVR